MARFIVIVRHVRVETCDPVFNRETGDDYYLSEWLELSPGQRISVYRAGLELFKTKKGWIVLPRDAWEWETPPVDEETFALTWQTSDSVRQLAECLRQPVSYVEARGRQLRDLGVELKNLPMA